MATYGSAEWAQQMYGNNSYKPPAQTYTPPAQTTSQPSYYQKYIEKMKEWQPAQQQQDYSRERYNAWAEQQYRDALLKYQEEQQRQESLWYKLTQQSAKDTAKEAGTAIENWYKQNQAAPYNFAGRGSSGMWGNAYAGMNRWTGLPWQNYGNLPLEAQYQYGLPTTREDYYRMANAFNQSQMPKNIAGMTTKKVAPTEDELNILREQRRGYNVGMFGIDGVVPPQVLGNPPTNNNGGGNSGFMFPDFGGYGGGGGGWSFPSYGGGSYKPSETASKWYNTMVQWNIGNKQA